MISENALVTVIGIFIGLYTNSCLVKTISYHLAIGKQNLNLTNKWDVLEVFFERSKCTKKTNSCLLITFLSTHAHAENFQSVNFRRFCISTKATLYYCFRNNCFVLAVQVEIKIIYIYSFTA